MITLTDYAALHYPRIKAQPYPDYIKVVYLLEVVQELAAEVAALKGQPQQPVEQGAVVWPPSPKRCTCKMFGVEVFGGDDKDFYCPTCGGGRF